MCMYVTFLSLLDFTWRIRTELQHPGLQSAWIFSLSFPLLLSFIDQFCLGCNGITLILPLSAGLCLGTLLYWHIAVLVHCCTGTLLYWHIAVLVHCCTGTLLYWYIAVLVHCCTGTLLYWYIAVLAHCCTGTLLYWHIAVLAHCCTGTLLY